jgi:molybdopterin-containing oxidoreductase family iron-sulfur binding subunit
LWRDADEFVHGLAQGGGEFPEEGAPDGWSRRTFMKLLGASVALATLEGCDRSMPEEIVPYSVRPSDVQPGVARVYATAMMLDGFASGLLVECHEGRPTKVEGNPEHPASRGATTLFEQALVLGLYDPDRLRGVEHDGAPSTWEALAERLRRPRTDRGAGLRLLLEPTTSPTVLRLLERARQVHPALAATFHQAMPALPNTVAGARVAFGRDLQPIYDFAAADVVVVIDADPLCELPMSSAYARAWAARRRIAAPSETPSRLYAVECAPSVTGMCADHRLRRRSAEIADVVRAIAAELPLLPAAVRFGAQAADRFSRAVARDLAARPPGTTLVVVGERQSPAVHALGFAINAALGNFGRTLRFVDALLPDGDRDLGALAAEMRDGKVDTLLTIGGNPVYDAPADLELARAMARVADRVYVGLHANETARASTWIAPLAHAFESWGDGRAYDGTLSLIQPLVQPLHGGRTAPELLALLAGERQPDARRLVVDTHEGRFDVDAALAAGVVPDSGAPTVTPAAPDAGAIARSLAILPRATGGAIEINFRRSPTVHDGRFANNGWLLEQPQPTTKLTWDNAVLVSPATASRLRLHTQDLVEVELEGRRVRGAVFVTPGHADDAVTLDVGWGRQGAESLARGRGFDAYRLRTTRAPAFGSGHLARVPGTHELATTQRQFDMHGRPIALTTTLDDFRGDPDFTDDYKGPEPSLMPAVKYEGLQWAMSIDLSICTGCSSCMVACQSENNVPIVGKEGVLHRRQMHWLRIDSYFEGSLEDPGVVHQPMLCQHCETAPCEYVCPVNATVHSSDGLNEMIYNRCVGTRFCSNNCPYKVRRFNWFNWHKRVPANAGLTALQRNPDVTVRDRGVMEKCSYCVQRIRRADIHANNDGRDIKPGEVVTACQQACPTGAIQFASLSHAESPMVKWRNEKRAYAVLNDQGTRPRTMYLARVSNPNPELAVERK